MFKNKTLCKDEFLIFTAYIMYVQGSQAGGFSAPTSMPSLNVQSLIAYFSQPARSLPQFEGIPLPQPPVQNTDPFS